MHHHAIDIDMSMIIYGTIVPGFHPSCNEQDAWILIDCLIAAKKPIDLRRLAPQQVCQQVYELGLVTESRALCA